MNKPYAGQILYSLSIGNAARGTKEVSLKQVVVKKVGRKYFVAGEQDNAWTNLQYNIEDWVQKSEYSATSKLYESEQAYLDEKESKEICRELESMFRYYGHANNLPIEKLRQIINIIKS